MWRRWRRWRGVPYPPANHAGEVHKGKWGVGLESLLYCCCSCDCFGGLFWGICVKGDLFYCFCFMTWGLPHVKENCWNDLTPITVWTLPRRVYFVQLQPQEIFLYSCELQGCHWWMIGGVFSQETTTTNKQLWDSYFTKVYINHSFVCSPGISYSSPL